MENLSIDATIRTEFGKKGTKSVRREGKVPCVLYGGNEVKHISINPLDVRGLIYTPDFKTAELNIDGTTVKCIIKKADFHPVTDKLEHIDFLELVPGQMVKYTLPVEYIGSSPGVIEGGKLIKNIRKVSVKSTPENMVDHVTLDISKLKLNDAIRIKDIKDMEGVTVINDDAIPVAIVEVPRALKSSDAEAAAEGEATEGEATEEGATEE